MTFQTRSEPLVAVPGNPENVAIRGSVVEKSNWLELGLMVVSLVIFFVVTRKAAANRVCQQSPVGHSWMETIHSRSSMGYPTGKCRSNQTLSSEPWGGANALFVDGSVELLSMETLPEVLKAMLLVDEEPA